MGRNRTNLSTAMILALALCLLPAPFWSSHAAPDNPSLVNTATVEGRLAVFDDVWETIQMRYYDPKYHGIDWQAKRTAFRPAAARAAGTYELYRVLRQMIASLKDAHTRVYSPDEKFDWWSPRYVTTGMTVREVEGTATIVYVEPNSAASRTDVRPGDIVVAVDDVPVNEFVARRLAAAGLSNDRDARYRAVSTLFDGPAGSSVKVSWTNNERKQKSAVLQRYWNQRQLGFNNQRKDNIAILRLDAFTQTVAFDFAKSLPSLLEDADGIVLDLRSNGGGDAEAMADIASLFLADGINLGKFADRSGASFELQTFSKRLWRLPRFSTTKLPLVVLTSEGTSSAAEILVATLQAKGRARVVGGRTCGCVLAIRNRHALPDGGILDVSEFDYRTAAGLRLEGAGIKPDHLISLRRADVYSRRDRAVEVAKKIIKENSRLD